MAKNKFLIFFLINALFILITFQNLFAHAPHDEIADVIHIKTYDGYEILTIVRGSLFRSTDEKNFKRIVQGLDNRGLLNHLEYSSCEKGYLFLSTGGDGIYCSNDLGNSWQKRNNGLINLNVDRIDILKTRPGLLLASGNDSGLFISYNWGEEWTQIKAIKNKITCIYSFADQVFLSDNTGKIFILEISDLSLKLIYSLSAEYCPVFTMAVTPLFPKTGEILVGTEHGLLTISIKNKISKLFSGLPSHRVTDIKYSVDYTTNNTLYALFGYEGFFFSKNNGKDWKKSNKGLSTDKQALAFGKPNYFNLRVSESDSGEILFISGFDGLFKSENSGKQWIQLNTLSENQIVGMAISQNYQVDSSIAYITYLNGPVISYTGGHSWDSLSSRGIVLDNLLSQGFIRLMDLTFCPNKPGSLLAISRSDIYQLHHLNGSWSNRRLFESNSRLIKEIRKAIFHEKEESTSLIENTDNLDDYLITTSEGKIYSYSLVNHHKSFITNIHNSITSVVASAYYKSDSTLFIGSADIGLYKAYGKKITYLGFQGDNSILIAVSPRINSDSTLFIGTYSGLYRSVNFGKSWSLIKILDFSPYSPVTALAISPNYTIDSTILLTLKGHGLFISDNGGISFRSIAVELIEDNISFEPLDNFPPTAGAIDFSPNYENDSTVYAFSGCSVFCSETKGKTWYRLPDYNFFFKKNFFNLCKGLIFNLKFDLLFMAILFIGLVLVLRKINIFRP
jgi:hypothetical protein